MRMRADPIRRKTGVTLLFLVLALTALQADKANAVGNRCFNFNSEVACSLWFTQLSGAVNYFSLVPTYPAGGQRSAGYFSWNQNTAVTNLTKCGEWRQKNNFYSISQICGTDPRFKVLFGAELFWPPGVTEHLCWHTTSGSSSARCGWYFDLV